MIEFLILTILIKSSNSIYGIKTEIEKNFFAFLNISFGSLHPAIKKLERKEYVKTRKAISKGGQRCYTYSITKAGKQYFEDLMVTKLPKNPSIASKLIMLKIFSLDKFEKNIQEEIKTKIKKYLELKKIELQNKTNKDENLSYSEKAVLNHEISRLNSDINWIESL
ncbi:MAG: PadR family transcriptional regulator [Candidatus Gastranaerophilales bacterium]|nr:PadR family transcriptional regulator [Candidatus Gastranaerophilales bacterium]